MRKPVTRVRFFAALPLAAVLACGQVMAQADADDCAHRARVVAFLGPGDSSARDAFGVRLLSAHTGALAGAGAAQAAIGGPGAAVSSDAGEQLLRAFEQRGGPTSALLAMQRGDFSPARAQWTDALAQARREGNLQAEGTALNDLGALDAIEGRSQAARLRFQEASKLFARLLQRANAPNANAQAAARASAEALNAPPTSINEMRDRLAAMQAAMSAATRQAYGTMGGQTGRIVALLNEANLVASLGQLAEAEPLFQQAATQQRQSDDLVAPQVRRQVMGDLAVFYRKAGRPGEAQAAARQVRGVVTRDEEDSTMGLPMWLLGEAGSGAGARPPAGDCATAMTAAVSEQPLSFAEAGHRWIIARAQQFEASGDLAGAMAAHARAAFLAQVIGSPERERLSRAALQRLALARGDTGAAIFYGKLAVNASQRLRLGVDGMSRQARQTFLADRRAPYANLAAALLDRGRSAEGEAVLRLLKEDEGQQFLDPAAAPARGSLPMTLAEAAWNRRLDALAEQARARYAERQAVISPLVRNLGGLGSREAEEQQIVNLTIETAENWTKRSAQTADAQQARALLAKPRGSRTSQEQDAIDAMQVVATRGATRIDELAAALRALRADSRGLRQPLSAEQARRAADLERRLEPVRQAWVADTRAFAAEPPPKTLSPLAQSIVSVFDLAMGGAPEQLRRLWLIDRQVEALEADSAALHRQLPSELTDASPVTFDAAAEAQLSQGQRTLATLPAGTAAVYYLQGEKRLDALVVTARDRRVVRLNADRAVLSTRIQRLRTGIERASLDVLTDARALYDLLWRPLEPALRDADAKTVMLSLDGLLSAVPFAALHDGKQWLVERHALNVYTSAARAALTARPAARWRVAAFGASVGGQVQGEMLKPLPGVREELAAVVQSGPAGASRGVMPGTAQLDGAFSAVALREALRLPPPRRPAVLHFASHFVFVPGDARRSALLLGDGSALTLTELGGADYRFDGIDLVTLSACRTGLTGNDAFGQQVEGLGTLLQAQGAASVLATLWSVDDGSTAAFMAAMYTLRERDGLSRAEAIRQAQLKMIRGDITPQARTLAPQRGGGRDDGDGSGPWAHPFHWAPFVLMGNWL